MTLTRTHGGKEIWLQRGTKYELQGIWSVEATNDVNVSHARTISLQMWSPEGKFGDIRVSREFHQRVKVKLFIFGDSLANLSFTGASFTTQGETRVNSFFVFLFGDDILFLLSKYVKKEPGCIESKTDQSKHRKRNGKRETQNAVEVLMGF